MNLYIVRHGQTAWNAENKILGITDIELNEEGLRQAEELALKMADKKIDIVITSPLKRAFMTGKAVADKLNIPLTTDIRLIEQNYGSFEGTDRFGKGFLNNKRNFAFKYPDGESMMQVAYRLYGFLDEIKEKCKGKNILIVTHGGVCRVAKTYFVDMTNDEFFNYSASNCQIEEYRL